MRNLAIIEKREKTFLASGEFDVFEDGIASPVIIEFEMPIEEYEGFLLAKEYLEKK